VLNQEHRLTQHVTSEIIPFGNTTASYNTIFGNSEVKVSRNGPERHSGERIIAGAAFRLEFQVR